MVIIASGHAMTGEGPGTWSPELGNRIKCEAHLPLKLRRKEETNFLLDFLLLGYF